MITTEKLETITDSSLFEQLANAILRIKFPELENLIESGINAKGKTIKDPLDAFCMISENHFALIEHTINSTNLEKKWLSPGNNSKSPEGDLHKAIAYAEKIREHSPQIRFTIYLVTNQRLRSDLQEKVLKATTMSFIDIVVVEQSIIADFLDNNSKGQYLRFKYLGIDAVLLSDLLLRDLLNSNHHRYSKECFLDEESIVQTEAISKVRNELELSTRALNFLIGGSGYGKSTIAYFLLKQCQTNNLNAIRIEPDIAEISCSLIEAIELQLKKEHPKIFTSKQEIEAFFYGSTLVIVDDVNKSKNSEYLLDRLISWSQSTAESCNDIKILCPVWPKNFKLIQHQIQKESLYHLIPNPEMSIEDGLAIIEHGLDKQISISRQQMTAIASETENNHLLLNLHLRLINNRKAYIPNQGIEIINSFIEDSLAKLAEEGIGLAFKLKKVIEMLGKAMITHRLISPTYDEFEDWFADDREYLSILERIAQRQLLFYFNDHGTCIFRHDRVRDWILISALVKLLDDSSSSTEIISEPFFSELLGCAITITETTDDDIDILLKLNPLAVFYSLKYLQDKHKEPKFLQIIEKIKIWNSGLNKLGHRNALAEEISRAFLNFDTKCIDELTNGHPESLILSLARFRNGNCLAGIRYIHYSNTFQPAYGNYWRDIVLEHVKTFHLESVVDSLSQLLREKITPEGRLSAYQLAGYLKSPRLIKALTESWDKSDNEDALICYIWAIINCADKNDLDILTNTFNEWANLKSLGYSEANLPKGEKNKILDTLSYTKWHLTQEQIESLSKFASNKRYKRIIYTILSKIDAPIAVQMVIKELGNSKNNSTRLSITEDQWERRKLSQESKDCILRIWKNTNNLPSERLFAYRIWSKIEKKEIILKESKAIEPSDSEIFDHSIFKRTLLGDEDVIKPYLNLIESKPWAVSWIANIWSKELKTEFKKIIQKAIEKKDGSTLHHVVEELREIDPIDAEEILIEFWDNLKSVYSSIATALFLSTSKTRELAHIRICQLGFNNWKRISEYYRGVMDQEFTINEHNEKLSQEEKDNADLLADEFKYIHMHYGCFNSEREKYISIEKLNSLKPYFILLSKYGLGQIAEQCQRSKYYEWLKTELYPHLSDEYKKIFLPSNQDILSDLEEFIEENKSGRIEYFINDLAKRGVERARFILCLEIFIQKNRNSYKAFLVVCNCLKEIGLRSDLRLLDEYSIEDNSLVEAVAQKKENTIYRVMRKTIA
ncbi:hypothetical protein [Niabella sp.]|uniref:hypothetical protein n=1 Tax=Niabella sp. TaxID=1962976 RepID=UPI00260DBD0C|nr:hypothetical protein [Niabella sp.]